jgi:hypothetical protein
MTKRPVPALTVEGIGINAMGGAAERIIQEKRKARIMLLV